MSSQRACRIDMLDVESAYDSVAMFQVHWPDPFTKGPVGVRKGSLRVCEPVALTKISVDGEHWEAFVGWKQRFTKARPTSARNLPAGDILRFSYQSCVWIRRYLIKQTIHGGK